MSLHSIYQCRTVYADCNSVVFRLLPYTKHESTFIHSIPLNQLPALRCHRNPSWKPTLKATLPNLCNTWENSIVLNRCAAQLPPTRTVRKHLDHCRTYDLQFLRLVVRHTRIFVHTENMWTMYWVNWEVNDWRRSHTVTRCAVKSKRSANGHRKFLRYLRNAELLCDDDNH